VTTYRLVDHLYQAIERGDGATLGALRRGWSQPLALYPIVAPFLPVPPSRHSEDVSMLIARLFGEHPKAGSTPFAAALQRVDTQHGSGEARMVAILRAPFVDLPKHLQRAIALIVRGGIAIDWHRLMDDLRYWNAEGENVQRAWAREFWSAGPETTTTKEETPQ
jgi:CRISPR system Cascade subunit CasB